MHETMVAQSLMTIISEEAARQNGKPIAAKVSCGTLNAVNDEVLCFAFEAITKGTTCEGVKLHVEHRPLQAQCRGCHRRFDVELSHPQCSQCGRDDFELLPDAPLVLEEIDFQTDDDDEKN